MDCFVASLLAMTYDSAFSRRGVRPSFAGNFVPREKREQGMPGARCTRGLVCKMHEKNAHEHTGSAEAIRHSLRNGSTAYGALSPEYRAFLPPSSREYGLVRPVGLATPPRDLTPTSEASGPHAFAVRSNPSSPKGSTGNGAVRPARRKSLTRNSPCDSMRADAAASTASPPAFVTIAIRPSCREKTGQACKGDLPDVLSEILPDGLICRRHGAEGQRREFGPCPLCYWATPNQRSCMVFGPTRYHFLLLACVA